MGLALPSFKGRTIATIAILLLVYPLATVMASNNLAYYMNVAFYSNKIFLVLSLFLFLSYLVLKPNLNPRNLLPQDLDDTLVYGLISVILVLYVASLHGDLDSLLGTETVSVGPGAATIGFGGLLADSFEIDRISINSTKIQKVLILENVTGGPEILKLHGGWESGGSLGSEITAVVNGNYSANLTGGYARLGNGNAGWIEAAIPAGVLKEGKNTIVFQARGQDRVFLTSQWVYHDGKTLFENGKYYGQEALVYVKRKPVEASVFNLAFDYQLLLKLAAAVFLILALFGLDTLKGISATSGRTLFALAALSIVIVTSFFFIQNQWMLLSLITGGTLSYILGLFFNVSTNFSDAGGPVIGISGFYIRIFKSCAGIETVSLFALLSMVLVCHNWRRMDKGRIAPLLVVGLFGAFIANILRLFLLIMVGAFVSADLAINIFHTNLGWVIMLVYFAIFSELVTRYSLKGSIGDANAVPA